jgi:hypothetical protein
MNPVQAFFNLFYTIDFVSITLTIAAGAMWAILFKDWEIDKRTVFLIASLYIPLLVGRVLYTVTSGEEVQTTYASIYYTIYFGSAILTRRLLHGRIVDSLPDKIKDMVD